MDLMEKYRQDFFGQYPPINISQLRPEMKIVVPDDPLDYGGGDLFMEVIEIRVMSNGQQSIVGKLTHPHCNIGEVGADVVAVSPFGDQVGQQVNGQ
jgi:hypothetical protein